MYFQDAIPLILMHKKSQKLKQDRGNEIEEMLKWAGYDLKLDDVVYSMIEYAPSEKEIAKRQEHLKSQEAKDFNALVDTYRK